MKKGLIITLSLIMIMCMPVFYACNEDVKPWLTANTEIVSFLNSSENASIISGEITYTAEISNEINNASTAYGIIDTYQRLLSMAFTNIEIFYGTFAISPLKNSSQASGLCGLVLNNLTSLENQIETFNVDKQAFIHNITTNGSLSSLISLEELRLFKLSFGKLIEKANNLQISFSNAYSSLYGGITDSTALTSNDVKNAVCQVYGEMLDSYVKYAIIEYNYQHPATTNFYNKLLTLENVYKNGSCLSTDYSSWLDFNELYTAERTMFLTSLNNVDLLVDNTSVEDLQREYLNKITNFVNTNAGLFVDKTIELLY